MMRGEAMKEIKKLLAEWGLGAGKTGIQEKRGGKN